MIKKEYYRTREDGVKLYKTYSDTNHFIKQVETGVVYADAIDVESAKFTYEETDDMLPVEYNDDTKSDTQEVEQSDLYELEQK